MAFTPFTDADQPTMAAFNTKFQEAIQAGIAGGLQAILGSYTGAGKQSVNITLPSSPFLFALFPEVESKSVRFGMSVKPWGYLVGSEASSAYIFPYEVKIDVSGNVVTLTAFTSEYPTVDKTGMKYTYFALCEGGDT